MELSSDRVTVIYMPIICISIPEKLPVLIDMNLKDSGLT